MTAIPPNVTLTGTYDQNTFWFVLVFEDGHTERWAFRWQATARAYGWTPPSPNQEPVALDVSSGGAVYAAAEQRAHDYETLVAALRRVVPRPLLAELVAHLDPLAPFLAYLRATFQQGV